MAQDLIDPASAAEIVRQEMDKLIASCQTWVGGFLEDETAALPQNIADCRDEIIRRLTSFPELEEEGGEKT